jgi:hypothetical protein
MAWSYRRANYPEDDNGKTAIRRMTCGLPDHCSRVMRRSSPGVASAMPADAIRARAPRSKSGSALLVLRGLLGS